MTVTQNNWTAGFATRTKAGSNGALAAILALAGKTEIISFAGGLPDPITLPDRTLGDLMAELVAAGDGSALQYSPVKGLAGTLDYVAERLETHDGRRPEADELMITSGCIEALELLGKTFLDAGDVALVEAPTYLGAIMGFRSFEANVVEVPMDEEGVRPELLAEAMTAKPKPKLFYTIPDYQNPTGVSLSLERRREVVELARQYGVLVVEDVTYRELGFYGDRFPSLWSLGPNAVVQIGTFSKTFFPGVRLGWAAGPRDVIDQMILAKQNTDQCAGSMEQRLLEEFGRRGLLDRQIDRAQSFYRRRRELMMDALQRHMPDGITWTEPRGGFVTWLTVPRDVDTARLASQAMDEKVAFVAGSVFFADESHGHNKLRLSFSGVQDELIDEGIRRLGVLLRRALGKEEGNQ